jgi:hypothetical protein
MSEWLLSRRDDAILAWHEVPGNRHPEPSRRVRSDSCRCTGCTYRIELWPYMGGIAKDYLRPIIPYPTGRFFLRTSPGTSCQATIGVSLRDALADAL